MTEGALALLAAELGNLDCGGEPPTRGRETLNGGLACYGVYRTADDRYLVGRRARAEVLDRASTRRSAARATCPS